MSIERLRHGPGIDERLTYRCYVGLDAAPTIRRLPKAVTRFTAVRLLLREAGYLLLARFERLRRRFRRPIVSPQLVETRQYAYRGLGSFVVRRLLAPPFDVDLYHRTPLLHELADLTWFERSRRIVDFEPQHTPLRHRMQAVFYLFAADRRDTIDRLFSWYVYRPPKDVTSWVYERDSGLVMCSQPLRHFQSTRLALARSYYELAILPGDLIDLERVLSTCDVLVLDSVATANLQDEIVHASLDSDMEVDPHSAIPIVSSTVRPRPAVDRITFDDGYESQADSNWHFIIGEIETAAAAGRALDETFVHDATQRQIEFATTSRNYGDGAGPTEQTAELMVRSVVELYQAGIDPSIPQE